MTTQNKIIEAVDIRKTYSMGASKVHVLKGVNMTVDEGEFAAVVGASGSGKSTLLHLLGTLDRPDEGTVNYKGDNLSSKSARYLNKFRNLTIGFVFQFYHLLDELTVLENVMLPAMISRGPVEWIFSRKDVMKRSKSLLDEFGMASRIKHKPYQLSGGERQRTALARALINQPELILADEPTGNLDSETGNGILEVLERLNRAGQSIVMVTHDERIARRASRIITLADGKIA